MQKSTENVAKSLKFLHSIKKWGSANLTMVSKFTPEVHKPSLRMRSTNFAENGRKCDYMLNF